MQERPNRVTTNGEAERPNVARIFDYYLGGAHNFAVDREFAERSTRIFAVDEAARAARSFLRRAVRLCAAAGIRQFLDLGSGIPTAGNVHEIAHAVDPAAKVVYVEIDAVAVAHGRSILADVPNAIALQADVRDPKSVLEAAEVRSVLDFDRPVAVLMIALLHFVPDSDDPRGIVADYLDALVPGSYLGITHYGSEEESEEGEGAVEARRRYSKQVTPMIHRTRTEFASLFGDLEFTEPGVVRLPYWRPESPDDVDEAAARFPGFAALGRKR